MLVYGCGSRPHFISDVNSIALSDPSIGKRYILVPGNQGITPDDLEFQEYARYIEIILRPLGFSRASTEADADIAIFVSYGVGIPQNHQYSSATPLYGQTGVTSSTTGGMIMPMGGGMASYSGNTTYTPTYGVTGYQTQVHSYTTYMRFLEVAAYDLDAFRREKRQRQVWKTDAVSTGTNNDLRRVVPYMVAAMKPYVAGNTGQAVRVEFNENESAVAAIRTSVSVQPQ
jgi:hypothetical protein